MKSAAYSNHRQSTTRRHDRAHGLVRVLSILGVLAPCVAYVAGAQEAPVLEEDHVAPVLEQIVWSETNDYPEFIPAPRLADPNLETWMNPAHYRSLTGAIWNSKSRVANNQPPNCKGSPATNLVPPGGTYLDAMLDVMLRANATAPAPGWVVLVGTIEDSILGWHARYRGVATCSLLYLNEILFDEANRLVRAEDVTFCDHYGVLPIAGTELCAKTYNRSEPTVGDEIVLVGWISETAGTRVQHHFHFLVRDGQVQHEPYISDDNWQPVTIEDLRQGIARRAKSKREYRNATTSSECRHANHGRTTAFVQQGNLG